MSAATNKTIVAFDLYGTLLSTESIAAELAAVFGDGPAKELAALWRRYQLEYTWRLNSMGIYRPFSAVTRGALLHAVAESGRELSEADADRLMHAYDALHAHPDVPAGLEALGRDEGVLEAYVFSNGTDDMVQESIATSPGLSAHRAVFRGVVTVHALQAFKPARRVYDDLLGRVGKEGRAGDVWLVSSNPFDVVGAVAAGLRAAWVDRTGKGWVDRLGHVVGDVQPTVVVKGVDEAVAEILKRAQS